MDNGIFAEGYHLREMVKPLRMLISDFVFLQSKKSVMMSLLCKLFVSEFFRKLYLKFVIF